MATTPETSTKPESAGTLFQALRNAGVEPDLAYRADDEVRNRAGQNVISVIGAKMDAKTKELGTRMDAQTTALETRIDKQGALLHAKIDTRMEQLGARMDAHATALETRIDKQGMELKADIKIDARTEELGARMDAHATALETRIDKQGMELKADIKELGAGMDAQTAAIGARIDAQAVQIASNGARIDDLRVLMLRVIWPLILLLAVPIFGELYRTLSAVGAAAFLPPTGSGGFLAADWER